MALEELKSWCYWIITFVLLERMLPIKAGQKPWRRESLHDGLWLVFNELFFTAWPVAVGMLLTALLAAWNFDWPQGRTHLAQIGNGDLIQGLRALANLRQIQIHQPFLQFLVLLLAMDFFFWLAHYLAHRVPFLWRFHQLHHSIEEMDWLAGFRGYWADIVWFNSLAYLPFLFIEADKKVWAVFVFLDSFVAFFYHSNLRLNLGRLGQFVVTPASHRLHHSSQLYLPYSQNFGIFTHLWDQVFGTFVSYDPNSISSEPLGLGTEIGFPKGFWGRLLYPFRLPRGAPRRDPAWISSKP